MGIVQRFERKLEGAVGDVFARVFGGAVVPREVEQRLQREISDGVRELDGGHLLAPNRFLVTLSAADHSRLAAPTETGAGDQQRVEDALARFVARHITASGWQTYGAIVVDLVGSSSLHTGQFRTSSTVDPDAACVDAADRAQPGAADMSHNNDNPGYGRRDPEPRERPGWDERNGWSGEPGAGRDAGPAGGAGYPAAAAGAVAPGAYEQRGWNVDGNRDEQGYHDRGAPQNYGRGRYDQGSPEPDQDRGHYEQGGYDQGGYDQGGYDRGGQNQGGYDQGYGGRSNGAPEWDRRREMTGTLHLDDGSGRTYRLKQGTTVIGRGQEAHFRLADTGVSRRHFEITWDGEVAMLIDLGSTNGTSVNESSVQNWQLADGDVVRAGHSSIVIRLEG